MNLIDKKLISLDQKVFPHILDFHVPGSELITVEHLLNHTVGCWPTTTRKEDPIFILEKLSPNKFI